MAKIKHPLHSLSAAGSVGKICFASPTVGGRASSVARMKPSIGRNGRTRAQLLNQEAFRAAMTAWRGLSAEDSQWWTSRARVAGIAAHSYFVSEYLIQMCESGTLPNKPAI